MLKRLTTVRHGEVNSNVNGFAPSEEEELSDRGLEQAKAVAKALQYDHFDIAYASPSERTVQTADEILIYHLGTAYVQDQRIRDPDLGECKGASIDDIRNMMIPNPGFRPPFGESMEDLYERICDFGNHLRNSAQGHVLVVSHNGPIMYLLGFLLGKPREEYMYLSQDNGAISVVEFTADGPKILFNSTEHLS